MSTIVRVKPAGHNLVRNPDAAMRHLDPAGEPVELNKYWRDRIKDGDVKVLKDSDVAVTETPAAESAKEKK